jgi:hypothetical protein
VLRTSFLFLCLSPLVLGTGRKRDQPQAVEASSASAESAPAPTPPESGDRGPMALVHQTVERPYRDIPMLSLDGASTNFGEIATAPVVFVVPWFTIHGSGALHFAAQIQELLTDVPQAQVLVSSADRAITPEDREVLQTLVKEAGIDVPVWTDPELKLLAVINASNTGERPSGNALWVAPLTAFSQRLEAVEPSYWDTDDLPALKAKLRAQVQRLAASTGDAQVQPAPR